MMAILTYLAIAAYKKKKEKKREAWRKFERNVATLDKYFLSCKNEEGS